MVIFEIVYPGTWIDYEDVKSSAIIGLIHEMESQFFTANAALNLFNDAQNIAHHTSFSDDWKKDRERRFEIYREIESSLGEEISWQHREEINFEADIRLKREQWQNGNIPQKFKHMLPFMHARSFLYALDTFEKCLGVLCKEQCMPAELAVIHRRFLECFPNLRGLRNTNQHMEDRVRGLGAGQKPKPIELKPVTTGPIIAPNGNVIILNSLNNTTYGSIMADGHFGEVDISSRSMKHLQQMFQEVLESLNWCGPKRLAPGY